MLFPKTSQHTSAQPKQILPPPTLLLTSPLPFPSLPFPSLPFPSLPRYSFPFYSFLPSLLSAPSVFTPLPLFLTPAAVIPAVVGD
jgi:hypothetical protein